LVPRTASLDLGLKKALETENCDLGLGVGLEELGFDLGLEFSSSQGNSPDDHAQL